jgi:hypothetical protein
MTIFLYTKMNIEIEIETYSIARYTVYRTNYFQPWNT